MHKLARHMLPYCRDFSFIRDVIRLVSDHCRVENIFDPSPLPSNISTTNQVFLEPEVAPREYYVISPSESSLIFHIMLRCYDQLGF